MKTRNLKPRKVQPIGHEKHASTMAVSTTWQEPNYTAWQDVPRGLVNTPLAVRFEHVTARKLRRRNDSAARAWQEVRRV